VIEICAPERAASESRIAEGETLQLIMARTHRI
jgi:hypothetical protein